MSGQPNRYASDPERFRAEFMATLALRADIDAMNLEANKTYKATGQLPAVSQMTDTRTTSEILADTEKIKADIIAELKTIGSANFALAVVQSLVKSPLNIGGSLLTFFAQRAPEIVSNLKRQYKYGISGDDNDVRQFVNFIEDMYNKTKSFSGSVRGYFNRPSDIYSSGVIKFGDLDKIQEMFKDITRKLLLKMRDPETQKELVGSREGNLLALEREIIKAVESIDDLRDLLSYDDFIQNTDLFIESQLNYAGNKEFDGFIDKIFMAYKQYNEILEELPKAETLYTLLDQMDTALKNSNPSLAFKILKEFESHVILLHGIKPLSDELELLKSQYSGFEKVVGTEIRDKVVPTPLKPSQTAPINELLVNRQLGEDILSKSMEKSKEDRIAELNSQLDELGRAYFSSSDPDEQAEIEAEFNRIEKELEFLTSYETQPVKSNRGMSDIESLVKAKLDELLNLNNQYKVEGLGDSDYRRIRLEYDDAKEEFESLLDKYKSTPKSEEEKQRGIEILLNPIKKREEILDKKVKMISENIDAIKTELIITEEAIHTGAKKSELKKIRRREAELSETKKKLLSELRPLQIELEKISELSGLIGYSMRGNGLPKRRGRPKGSGIGKHKTYKEIVKAHTAIDKGIEQTPRFVKFGKYLINTQKLNEDTLAIKQPSGGNIMGFPSTRISKNMSHVIKKMIGGSVPTYAELSKLSEPEKAYLHKISSKANILDKFSIPAPDKDKEEKDIHDFEVMKGEIMAGNDSKELIKKFKLHLVKLSKNNTLPKKEVQEVMEELISLGF